MAVRVGEDAATVDVLTNGRFDLGLGQGYALSGYCQVIETKREAHAV